MIAFGRQVCGDLDAAASREWLVTDGLGGYAMGTVAGLRTRRYHGLLVVAEPGARARRLGLAALDPVVRIGDRRIRLATDEWVSGVVDPAGYRHLASFTLDRGVPVGGGTSATSSSSVRLPWPMATRPSASCSAWSAHRTR